MKHKILSTVTCVGFAALLCSPSLALAQSVGRAASFAIVGGAEVRANGAGGTVDGDVGIDPAAATFIFGFPGNATIVPPFSNHGNDVFAIAAAADVQTLYDSPQLAPAGGLVIGADLSTSGPTANGIYTPGKYFVSVGTAILPAGTSMTLNGAGQYIFTVNSDLTTLTTATINFNGVDPCNVWWRVPTQATIDNPNFPGNVVSNANITLGTSTHLFGRALTTDAGRVILSGNNLINTCSSAATPVPTSPPWAILALMALLALAGFVAMRRRTA
jgi:MYXO-CTERM domain-containing protein